MVPPAGHAARSGRVRPFGACTRETPPASDALQRLARTVAARRFVLLTAVTSSPPVEVWTSLTAATPPAASLMGSVPVDLTKALAAAKGKVQHISMDSKQPTEDVSEKFEQK